MPLRPSHVRHHLAHLLGRVERVDAAGLAVGPAAVAPDVVGAGERRVARGVLALEGGGVAVRHRERRARSRWSGCVTEPSQLPLPVPSRTCSLVVSTRPVRASTYTVSREASPCLRPVTQVSQASREPLRWRTTSRVLPSVACRSWRLLVARAAALATVALTERSETCAGLGDAGGQDPAVVVGRHHEVTADHGDAAVGALVGDVAEPHGARAPCRP